MSSNILAFLFAAVMLTLTLTNHIRESAHSPSFTPSPSFLYSAPPVFPSFPPSTSPSPTPKSSPLSIPTPSPISIPTPSPSPKVEISPAISPPKLSAKSYLLSDDQGIVLTGRNINEFLPIASLTKLMTAVILNERLSDKEAIKISENAMSLNQNTYGLLVGDTIGKQEALEFILVASSNIVAQSIADTFGEREFISWMNSKALELGMYNTIFIDATGLANFNRSSASDIIKLLRYISSFHPEILAISRSPKVIFRKGTSQAVTLFNTNELSGKVAGIIGGKTGYTDEAGECLALVFEWRGRKFYAVVLGSKDRAEDMKNLIEYAWNLL